MAKYTLRTLTPKGVQWERYEHRSPQSITSILLHDRIQNPKPPSVWDDEIKTATHFEIYDSHQTKIFEGNAKEALAYSRKLKK